MFRKQNVSWIVLGLCAGLIVACSEESKKRDPKIGIENKFVLKQGQEIRRVYGPHLADGDSPMASAAAFVQKHADQLDVLPDDLKVMKVNKKGDTVQPIMYDSQQGAYRYNLVRYQHFKEGIPVFRSALKVLVRNGADHSVVLANANLRRIRNFAPKRVARSLSLTNLPANIVLKYVKHTDFVGNETAPRDVKLTHFSKPETVIWAGLQGEEVSPRVAVAFIGDNTDDPARIQPEKWLLVMDKETGEILYRENQIHYTAIEGNVKGMVTEGAASIECSDETLTPFPYANVLMADESGVSAGSGDDLRADAVGALTALGYRLKDAEKVVTQFIDEAETSEQLIKMALQSMSGGTR